MAVRSAAFTAETDDCRYGGGHLESEGVAGRVVVVSLAGLGAGDHPGDDRRLDDGAGDDTGLDAVDGLVAGDDAVLTTDGLDLGLGLDGGAHDVLSGHRLHDGARLGELHRHGDESLCVCVTVCTRRLVTWTTLVLICGTCCTRVLWTTSVRTTLRVWVTVRPGTWRTSVRVMYCCWVCTSVCAGGWYCCTRVVWRCSVRVTTTVRPGTCCVRVT